MTLTNRLRRIESALPIKEESMPDLSRLSIKELRLLAQLPCHDTNLDNYKDILAKIHWENSCEP
jgi:hypothetical protein